MSLGQILTSCSRRNIKRIRLSCDGKPLNSTEAASGLPLHFARQIVGAIHTSSIRQQIKPQAQPTLNIFDRKAKQLQRERATLLENVEVYDYLKEETGYRLADRIFDIKRKFSKILDLGCGRGYIVRHVVGDHVEKVVLADNSETLMSHAYCEDNSVQLEKVVCDEEHLNDVFQPDTFDLVISNLILHWVNDLPSCFQQVMKILKKDGIFLASVFGNDTLYQLRSALQLAELERRGGISPHISPFARPRDIGGLLTRAGFAMQTIDTDEIVVTYPSMLELITDLKGMGESNASWNRSLHLPRETILAASAIYQQLYGSSSTEKTEKSEKSEKSETGVPASFQIISFIGWKPDASQPKPAERGSADISLKELYKLGDVIGETTKIPLDEEK